ncbi:hypothetical protein [Bacillus sp. FJAT-28004]|uniref:hypothetical protein n=1 Tax=Bacillus sp. FJAT-28004 TaxID=1679165 RepID=UPI000B266403|nr:hypothetical protein [Bacillus sp. FJAT-28004]
MDSAKEAIQSFGDKLPKNAEVSLRVYGHKEQEVRKIKKYPVAVQKKSFMVKVSRPYK